MKLSIRDSIKWHITFLRWAAHYVESRSSAGIMKSTKVLIIGASGFIGSRLLHSCSSDRYIGTYMNKPFKGGLRLDIATERLADRFLLRGHGYTHAVLAQGVTTLNQCALAPKETSSANVTGTEKAIDDLIDAGVHPIFLSSDGVFDGSRGPWTEQDAPCPILTYGKQKSEVEFYLSKFSSPWTILRLSKVLSSYAAERNLLSQWLEHILKRQSILCAKDQILSPIDVDDVVRIIEFVVETSTIGLFNASGSDVLTRLELLKILLAHCPAGLRDLAAVQTCFLNEVPSAEPLPVNCSLLNVKLRSVSGISPASIENICARFCEHAFFQRLEPEPSQFY
jgi:dTDP-4-dehydrorhamnose reductase